MKSEAELRIKLLQNKIEELNEKLNTFRECPFTSTETEKEIEEVKSELEKIWIALSKKEKRKNKINIRRLAG